MSDQSREATPRPWEVLDNDPPRCGAGPHDFLIGGNRHESFAEDEDGNEVPDGESVTIVAVVKGNPTAGIIPRHNAEFLVLAANAHAALVAAVKELTAAWGGIPEHLRDKADAALKLAGEA